MIFSGISSNASDDSPFSWTEKPFHPFTEKYKDAPICRNNKDKSPARNLVRILQMFYGHNHRIEKLGYQSTFLKKFKLFFFLII